MINVPKIATITNIVQENYRTKTFEFDLFLDAEPGQFIMAWLPRFDEKPFSLVNHNPLTLMVTAVGPFSTLLHQRQVGDQLWIRGPFGQGYQVAPNHRRIALIGGGYGVAPLYWLAQHASRNVTAVKSILGARQAQDILYRERFLDLAHVYTDSDVEPLHELYVVTEDGSLGERGRVTDLLEPMLVNREIDAIFACGPDGMLAALERLAVQYNVPAQLSWEAYMRCAIGICGACDHHGQVLCMDGPVLSVNSLPD